MVLSHFMMLPCVMVLYHVTLVDDRKVLSTEMINSRQFAKIPCLWHVIFSYILFLVHLVIFCLDEALLRNAYSKFIFLK